MTGNLKGIAGKLNVYRPGKAILSVLKTILIIYAASELFPWLFYLVFWNIFLMPVPPASAWYDISIVNSTEEALFVQTQLLNDIDFRQLTSWEKRQRSHLGWNTQEDRILMPHRKARVTIPSQNDPRLGIVLVTVRSVQEQSLRQRIGMYLLSWPWQNGSWLWRTYDSESGWPEQEMVIKAEDLTVLDLDELRGKPGDPLGDVPIKVIRLKHDSLGTATN